MYVFNKKNINEKVRNIIFIKLEENYVKNIEKVKLNKICNKYNINVVRCFLIRGKFGLRLVL